VKNNAFLDYPGQDGWGYAVFGKVVEGTDVVDAIRKSNHPAAACLPTCQWKTWSSKHRTGCLSMAAPARCSSRICTCSGASRHPAAFSTS
jgi:hypothetical protein